MLYGVPSYSLTSSYHCHKSKESYTGKITRISKDMIYVSVKNVEYTLQVHSCSILQSVTAFSYPRIGDRIYFKGHPKVAGGRFYDLEIGLCY